MGLGAHPRLIFRPLTEGVYDYEVAVVVMELSACGMLKEFFVPLKLWYKSSVYQLVKGIHDTLRFEQESPVMAHCAT